MERDLERKLQAALDTTFEQRVDLLRSEMIEQLSATCGDVLWPAMDDARTHAAEVLSAAARRIRAEESVTGIAAALVETASHYCGRSALLIHKNHRLLGFQAEGLEPQQRTWFQQIDIGAAEAAAFAHAIDTKDPVVTTGTVNELSAEVVDTLDVDSETRVHLFPVVLRDSVLALLYTDDRGFTGQPQTAAIELLTFLAEAWIEAVGARGKLTPMEQRAAS